MVDAFWDASSLVPLFVNKGSSSLARQLSRQYGLVVWWATPVEVRSAFARLLRMGQATTAQFTSAQIDLSQIQRSWREVAPSKSLRDEAEAFVDHFQLRAADAQQLAAAHDWSLGRPVGRVFISGDMQLLEAARQLGFQVIAA
jgi:predicted nucleic acid-binding protein